MPPRRGRADARKTAKFRYCPLVILIRRVRIATVPAANTVEDHNEASYFQAELHRDFLISATDYRNFVQEALDNATAVPVPSEHHLDNIRGHFNDEADCFKRDLQDWILGMELLPLDYKQELEQSLRWRTAAALVEEADRMVETLNHPASIERRQIENQSAPGEFTLSAGVLRTTRKGVLDTWMRKSLKMVEQFSTEPLLPTSRRGELVQEAIEAYTARIEESNLACQGLRDWAKGRVRPEIIRQHLESSENEELEKSIDDHLFALYHAVLKSTMTDNYAEPWTEPRLDALRKVLKAPKDILVDPAKLKKATQITRAHLELMENFCLYCYGQYEDPTCIVLDNKCHHVFCFGCIVPWVDQHSNCPKCRAHADPDNLQRLTVTRVEENAEDQADVEQWKKEALEKMKQDQLQLQKDLDEIAERMAESITIDGDGEREDDLIECMAALNLFC